MDEERHDNKAGVIKVPEGFVRETDYRLSRFLEWSPALEGLRVGIYGSGANARRIINASRRMIDPVAVIDDNAVGSQVCGHSAMRLRNALAMGLDTIVVAAELDAELVIFRRIRRLCIREGVRVLDMYGNDLEELRKKVLDALTRPLVEQLGVIDSCQTLCINASLLKTSDAETPLAECLDKKEPIDRCIWSVVSNALARGKRVVFCTDDHDVKREDVLKILALRGLDDLCPLLLGGEIGLWAKNGLYRSLYDLEPNARVVHIGPDLFKDCLIPLALGSESILTRDLEYSPDFYRPYAVELEDVPKGAEWFSKATGCRSIASEERLGRCAEKTLPAVAAECGHPEALTASYIAALVIGYVTWLTTLLNSEPGSFDGVLFASRDGFLVKQAYDMCRARRDGQTLPESRYFYTSRKACLAASQDEGAAHGARSATLAYLDSLGLGMGHRYAFVEFVGAGTCQKLLETFVPFKMKGFYFGSRIGEALRHNLDSELYFDDTDASFLSRYLLLETLIGADEPSLEGFSQDGVPVFSEELRTYDELTYLRRIHKGVSMFFVEYFSSWYEPGDVIDHGFVNDLMPSLDACGADRVTLYNDVTGLALSKDIWSVIPPEKAESPNEVSNEGAADSDEGVIAERQDVPKAFADPHRILLDILGAFDSVCREHGLTYVATHGTLLGAMRTGGFVQGDNDIDVAMPRRDYDQLLVLAEKGAFSDAYFLQTPENDPVAFFGGYAKLRPAGQACHETSADTEWPDVWMDIMPLDNCPLDNKAADRRQRVIRQWQRALYAKTYGLDLSKLWDVNPKRLSTYFIMAEHMSRRSLCRHLRKACMACKPSGLLTIFAGNYRLRHNTIRFSEGDVCQPLRAPFEDTAIPIPHNARSWLETHYGKDWDSSPADEDARDV